MKLRRVCDDEIRKSLFDMDFHKGHNVVLSFRRAIDVLYGRQVVQADSQKCEGPRGISRGPAPTGAFQSNLAAKVHCEPAERQAWPDRRHSRIEGVRW